MSEGANARRERGELLESAPLWARTLRPLIVLHHRVRRLLGGMYVQGPFSYQIFTQDSPDRRRLFEVSRPVVGWRGPKLRLDGRPVHW